MLRPKPSAATSTRNRCIPRIPTRLAADAARRFAPASL
jgi:hypothetical protein